MLKVVIDLVILAIEIFLIGSTLTIIYNHFLQKLEK